MTAIPSIGLFLAAGSLAACAAPGSSTGSTTAAGVVVAELEAGAAGNRAFQALRAALVARNPGYDVEWLPDASSVVASDAPRVAFVQGGAARATVEGDVANASDVGVGDAILLRPLDRLVCSAPLSLLVFRVVEPLPGELPPFLRPDFDPAIDDQRGGCATEDDPYRRLLLTWRPQNGPYVYHGLNAHRVRISDSFTHYHPKDGGFDELYLVQRTKPGATLFTSDRREAIEAPESVSAMDAGRLLLRHELVANELIYIPRGAVHRGTGGAIVQVITIPGFKPGAEIGVDHHLRAIADRVGAQHAPPYNVEASKAPVVR